MKLSTLTLVVPALILTVATGCRLETEDLNPQPAITNDPNSGTTTADSDLVVCRWYDGNDYGIGRRGWHAVKIVQGIHYSVEYFNSASSYDGDKFNCYNKLVQTFEKTFYADQIAESKKTTCACRMFDGKMSGNSIGPYGWHLSFKIEISELNQKKSTNYFSSQYFNSASSYAGDEENCKRKLVEQNFVCK